MTAHETSYAREQRERWLRPDAERWVRPDLARYLAPGSPDAGVYAPLDRKYSPSQPRVPAGSGRESGRWTSGQGGSAPALPSLVDLLFQITPNETDNSELVQVAGDWPAGDSPELPSDEPPDIPPERPKASSERTGYLRAAANWLGRNAGLAADIYVGFMRNVEWLNDYHDVVQAARDEPKALDELRDGVGLKRPGYDDHHIVEQTWAERFGFSRSEIDDPSNVVSIPRLKHYQITGWYGASSEEFDGLSPRNYLRDKSWDERRRVGLYALRKF